MSPRVAGSIEGIHINRITSRIAADGFDAGEVEDSIKNLCKWGLMYNTIDENTFQRSEHGYRSVLNDATLQVIKSHIVVSDMKL